MKSLDLNALSWFCEMVEAGNMTLAAKQLGVSAPTLSRNLVQLEERVGQKLLHRSAKRFQLTTAGERYYNALSAGFSHLQEQISLLSDDGETLRGSIRVSCPESMAIDYLHGWVVEFLKLHPEVDINLKFAINDQQFIDEQLDLSLVVLPPTQPGLVQKKIFDTEMWVAASPEYLASHGAPTVPQDLPKFDLLTSDPAKGWGFITPNGRYELTPTPRYVISSIRGVVDAAVNGLGIVYGPRFYLQAPVDDKRLVRLLTDFKTELRHVYMVYADKRLMPTRVRAFKAYVEERLMKFSML
ncbi:LysR family transcriptional regulator [Maritalea porphyrae]|uniref:LysR family transcriptional regulator n=1 Tax=Maritalea porphyrae TaxID=880732 RepID=UPI0022AFE7A7|nr:LysR family transcriptional regulator [Maritalea porphyrae]MCZ4273561.1 LysR family transcriptional regulator [Maritalea porphyrae]